MIPVIETERLILRGMGRQDFPAFAAIWTEPDVVRFIGGKPFSETESWGRFKGNAGSWVLDGHGQWGIFHKADGVLLGQVGFFMAKRGLGVDFDGAPEAGWVLSGIAQGQGYGPEAVAAAHRWFDAQSFGGISWVMIDVDHAVSLALAGRFGYERVREATFMGDNVMLLVRRRSV
jgi:RimJ/RimL family protein N-acetyltransferase